jgi:hypothetical protein
MPVKVIWDNDAKTIQRYVYEGRWTWDELYAALSEGQKMLDTVDHLVDGIVDLQGKSYVPSNALVHLKRVMELMSAHPNVSDITVFLRAEAFVKALTEMLRKLYPSSANQIQFNYASTLEDAHALIAELRSKKAQPT